MMKFSDYDVFENVYRCLVFVKNVEMLLCESLIWV